MREEWVHHNGVSACPLAAKGEFRQRQWGECASSAEGRKCPSQQRTECPGRGVVRRYNQRS